MPRPALRSRKLARSRVKTPGRREHIRYQKKMVSPAHCSCGRPLSGVPRERDAGIGKLPKSKKRPSRPYGGSMCSPCTRERIKSRVVIGQ